MSILDKFLKHKGIKNFVDLNDEERKTFKEWEASLAGRTISQDEYRNFLESELSLAIGRLTEIDLSKEAEIFRKVEVRLIKKILSFLDMPLVEKSILETQIESQL